MHIIVGLKPHGAETMLKRLVEATPAAIPNTVVVSLTTLDVVGASLRDQGIVVHALNMTSVWSVPEAFWRLTKLIHQFQPDIVQTWMYHADLLGGLAARWAGCRNVVWGVRRTAVSFSDLAKTAIVMKVCAVLSRWVPKKVVCNAEAARIAHSAAGYSADRIVVIPNGFDFSRLSATSAKKSELRRAFKLPDDVMTVGAVGRFHPDKGQLNFIKAAAILSSSRPDVRYLLVGRGCDSRNATLGAWLDQYGLKDRFVLLGERTDVPVCLAIMDVFCMPSCTEGFPNGLGEAMAMGLPCVATKVGDTAVLTGDTAVLVPPEDEQALAHGLLSLISMTSEQREQMGLRAKLRVTTEFSIEKARQHFDALYQELLSGAKP